eukprot:NODE_2286_length_1222_cov_31.224658_g2174_i0.p1 GENE.NODE_2286_length_1222_cov_31.224658_g2174_i0~~NODE_2286_length_1222_cov_31.224658_g2174_i0.p1  ORF type:complete len:395 (+),score=96.83 NODE_2286_length_1222_cov_31.224658_g2174_i0:175-1185(+)
MLLAGCCFLALSLQGGWLQPVCFGGLVVFGSISRLGNVLSNICVVKEWPVTLSQNNEGALSDLNATMRRIDLLCKILAPMLSGALSSQWSPNVCISVIIALNLVSYPIQVLTLRRVYADHIVLHTRRTDIFLEEAAQLLPSDPPSMVNDWKVYAESPAFLASLAYSLLYASVINWGSIFTAYMKWRGMDDWQLALGRGLAAFLGLTSTLCYKHFVSTLTLQTVALYSVWSFFLCVCPILFAGSHFILVAFLSLTLSRFALWTYDLALNQLIQTIVPAKSMGTVFGCQQSLVGLSSLFCFAQAIVFSSPLQFNAPLFISALCVVTAALCHSIWHLTH